MTPGPLKATYLSLITAVFALSIAVAKDPPASAEQLRSELEAALSNRDTNAFLSLICWDEVTDEWKPLMVGMFAAQVRKRNTNDLRLTLASVPTNFQFTVANFRPDWQGDDGRRGKYNLPVVGLIRFDQRSELPVGKKGDAFYIAQLVSYQIPGKALNVRVDNLPTWLTYTGYWTYVKDGKEVSVIINDQTNRFKQGWGDYVKQCTVRRTSTSVGDYFQFRITEDDTNIFESGPITNQEPVTYQRQ